MREAPRPRPLEYASRHPVRWRHPVAVCLIAFALSAVVGAGAVLLPSLNQPRVNTNRLKCASHLRQIGQGVQMFANENRGLFPDDLTTLFVTQDLTSEVFVCPHANVPPSGQVSYTYTGKGMSIWTPPNAVLAYEPLANHGDGMHVLFADFHVEWLGAPQARKLLAELAAGHNPPRAAAMR